MAETRRVLIVDDSMTVCSLIEKILRSCEFAEIEAVQNGQAALDRLQAAHFDIVICDWEMAPMSGIEVLNKVRQRDNIKNTYFILMSAKRDMDWILAAKKAGADGLITKPFTPETLKQKISQLGATHALA
jgi:two-component system chemotaxis response regulator CheY